MSPAFGLSVCHNQKIIRGVGSKVLLFVQYEQKEYDSCSWENEDFGEEIFRVTMRKLFFSY